MRLGIYIGSFNPPHQGHIDVVNYLLDKMYVDKILIVPTLNYWDKQDLVDIKHRINMLKFYENQYIEIDTKNNQYKYTYQLMNALENEYPCDELYLIIGADNIIHFEEWKNYHELLKYNIIVMNRDHIDIEKYIEKYSNHHFIVVNDYQYVDISSTEIRKNLNSDYLDKRVRNYICKYKLYERR